MVRAEENRVRALRAMIVMQGIGNGMQAFGNSMQQQALYRPPPRVFYTPPPSTNTFQEIRQMQQGAETSATLSNMNNTLNRVDRYLRWNAPNYY